MVNQEGEVRSVIAARSWYTTPNFRIFSIASLPFEKYCFMLCLEVRCGPTYSCQIATPLTTTGEGMSSRSLQVNFSKQQLSNMIFQGLLAGTLELSICMQ